MRALIVSALALTVMTSAALAADQPVQLTDKQLASVTAGGVNVFVPIQGQGGNGFGGACQACFFGPTGVGGDGISVVLFLD
jgi:hypothetical protein